MKPIMTTRNQYRGINAHLHSYLLDVGGWPAFHNNLLTYSTQALKARLLPMGYTAETEQSLQIRRFDEPSGKIDKPRSDISIYDMAPQQRSGYAPVLAGGEAIALPELLNIDEDPAPYNAVTIYEFLADRRQRGEPVAWIELLSPSNKPGGQDGELYLRKRQHLIERGIVFVELDYLHTSPATFDYFPYYGGARTQPGATTYRILVIDPRPSMMKGVAYPHGFHVDDPIPAVTIPLSGEDRLHFDFNAPYQRTVEEMFYGLEFVDYTRLPIGFDLYSPADQSRILGRMQAVIDAAQAGRDVEVSGFEAVVVEDVAAAMARMAHQPA
jgi:Protein of unknown function (DUF4058)